MDAPNKPLLYAYINKQQIHVMTHEESEKKKRKAILIDKRCQKTCQTKDFFFKRFASSTIFKKRNNFCKLTKYNI